MTTNYETIIVQDSGAVEFADETFDEKYNYKNLLSDIKELRNFPNKTIQVSFEMYDDKEFNSLNDIIHSPINFIVNDRLKEILKECNLPPHRFLPAKIRRKEKGLFTKKTTEYNYNWLCMDCESVENFYDYIDFKKSEIVFFRGEERLDNMSISNIEDLYLIIQNNKILSSKANSILLNNDLNEAQKKEQITEFRIINWEALSIKLNENFNRSIDIFNLPLFSWMTFVSTRLKEKLIGDRITDIKFIPTGLKSRLEGVRNPKLVVD